MDENFDLAELEPDQQTLVVQLASLLEIGFPEACKALRYCQWNFEVAVDAACQLVSSAQSGAQSVADHPSSQSSNLLAGPARPVPDILHASSLDKPDELELDFPEHMNPEASTSASSTNESSSSVKVPASSHPDLPNALAPDEVDFLDRELDAIMKDEASTSVSSTNQSSSSVTVSEEDKLERELERIMKDEDHPPMFGGFFAEIAASSSASSSSQSWCFAPHQMFSLPPLPSGLARASSSAGYKRSQSCLVHDAPDVFVSAGGPSAFKRKRLEITSSETSEAAFKIPNNNRDAPVDNPPMFKAYPLREEQRRSLGWMLKQEADEDAWVKGGLLADRMGYGKTSTAIGLISLDAERKLRQPGSKGVPLQRDGKIPSDSTLIVCPAHLIDQWEGEFWKFLGSDGVEISKSQDADYIKKNSSTLQFTYKFKAQPSSRFDKKFHIDVAKCPSGWRRSGNLSVITCIGPEFQKRLTMVSPGSHNRGLRVDDMIQKIECKKLRTPYGQQASSNARTTLAEISGVLGGCSLQKIEKIKVGEFDLGGRKFPRWDTRFINLEVTESSEFTFTVLRMKEPMQKTHKVKGEGPLKVLTLRSAGELAMLQVQQLISQYHVILASTRIHSDMKYADYVKDVSGESGLMGNKIAKLQERVQEWCVNKATFKTAALQRSPPIFEIVSWRRVILDEFHESEAWEYRVREMLGYLEAEHKWGLSGTPPLGSPLAVAEVACVLGYSSPDKDGDELAQAGWYRSSIRQANNASKRWLENLDKARIHALAQEFVTAHIRQNTSELIEQIGVVEHDEFVEHTPEEKLIYRQACHDQGIFDLTDGYSHMSLESRAELLKRCAHFDMGAADSASAAVNQLGTGKRDWLSKAEQQLWVEAARMRLFKCWDKQGRETIRKTSPQHPDAKALVERVLASSVEDVERELGELEQSLQVEVKMLAQDGSERLRPIVQLVQPIREQEYYKNDRHRHAVVHAVAKRIRDREADVALSELAVCEQACFGGGCLPAAFCSGLAELVTLVDKAHRSLQFYTSQLNNLKEQNADNEGECSICLESTSDIRTMAILPCSHVFHSECIRAVLAQHRHCPECRTPVETKHVKSVVMELKTSEPEEVSAPPTKNMSAAWKANGSKLNAVADRIREIRKEDPTAKCLVFVQWADLEEKVCCALTDHGLPFMALSKRTRTRASLASEDGAVLNSFQQNDSPDAPFVLVLSLQRAAAGTNLTSASHVLFVHPMNAETVHVAAAYERQALGRVRRIGQTRKEVHVWRFITKQTVEEHVWKLHRDAPEDAEMEEQVAENEPSRDAPEDAE